MTAGRVRPTRRGLALAGAVVALALGFLPVTASAAETQLTLTPDVEAWYRPDPTCGLPTGCISATVPPGEASSVPPSPYPASTLHVSVESGSETARSYLSFVLPRVDARLAAASLEVPLDTATQSGSLRSEAAEIVVCAFDGTLEKAEGAYAEPPSVSCDAFAPMEYVAAPAPRLVADLSPLLPGIAVGGGLALVPDASKTAGDDAWHVVFSAHDRADATAPAPAALTITLVPADEQSVDHEPSMTQAPLLAMPPPVMPSIGGSTRLVVAPPELTAPPAATATPSFEPVRTIRMRYAYGAVWLLPLALLVFVPLVVHQLTRDLRTG